MRDQDSQLVELAGRNWLASQLQSDKLEVARPERDHGIDLLAYVDRDRQVRKFVACPIQMKAATNAVFSLDTKYKGFPGLLLVYVWHLNDPAKTAAYALTYREAVGVVRKMAKTNSWQRGNYSSTRPSVRLHQLLKPFRMGPGRWGARILELAETDADDPDFSAAAAQRSLKRSRW